MVTIATLYKTLENGTIIPHKFAVRISPNFGGFLCCYRLMTYYKTKHICMRTTKSITKGPASKRWNCW